MRASLRRFFDELGCGFWVVIVLVGTADAMSAASTVLDQHPNNEENEPDDTE